MKRLRILAWTSTVTATLFTFTIGYFKLTNAGLADWTGTAVVAFGTIVGLLLLAVAVLAFSSASDHPRVSVSLSLAAVLALLIIGCFWMGGGYGSGFGLHSTCVTVSMIVTLLALFASMELRFIRHPYKERKPAYPDKLGNWLIFVLVLVAVQMGIGTYLQYASEVVMNEGWTSRHIQTDPSLGPVAIVHQTLGVLVALIVLYSAGTMIRQAEQPSVMILRATTGSAAAAVGLMFVGVLMLLYEAQPILQVFHSWLTVLLFGTLLMMLMAVRYNHKPTISQYLRSDER